MRYYLALGVLLLILGLFLSIICNDVSYEDFKISGEVAYIEKRFDDFHGNYVLSCEIARHMVAAMEIVEDSEDLRYLHTVVFTYTGPVEDKYGNMREDIWARVSVPIDEWFQYTEEIRHSSYEVRKRMLREFVGNDCLYPGKLLEPSL